MNHKAPRLGAALAYYTIFALAPLLVIAISMAGLVFGHEAAQGQIAGQVEQVVGSEGGQAIQAMVRGADKPGVGVLAAILGGAMLFLGAGGLFGELQDALNTVWEVKPKSGRGIWGLVRDRFLSFSMVLGFSFLLLVSLLVSAALSAVGGAFGAWQASVLGHGITTLLDLGVITILFAMIFRFLPDAEVSWRDVWFGAGVTSVLFVIGKFLIGLYLGQVAIGSAYGAAGSLAVLLVWLYYAAQIFLFGAELTRSYADHFGSRIEPKAHAQRVSDGKQAPPRDGTAAEAAGTPEVMHRQGSRA
ncbi:MAG: YihY/virulence factor BrkB family protein [Gemmataceae bacterium]